jgi:hypothetical protein
VRNNRFDCNSGNDTGALFIQTYSGNIDNVVIEGNLLEGATYQLVLGAGYGHNYSNMSAINNRMSGTGYGAGNIDNVVIEGATYQLTLGAGYGHNGKRDQ